MGPINKFLEEQKVDRKVFWTLYCGVKRKYHRLGMRFNRHEFFIHLSAIMAVLKDEENKKSG